jgi:CheY-like chemotaxis protein
VENLDALRLKLPKSHKVSNMSVAPVLKNEFAAENQLGHSDPKLKELTDKYAQELPSRLEQLAHLILKAEAGSTEAIQSMITEAHKLRGTARLFGFPAIAEAMTNMENLLIKDRVQALECRDSGTWDGVKIALASAKIAVCDPESSADLPIETTNYKEPHKEPQRVESVLLVDDDPSIRCIAEISLANVGNWQVSVADSGKKALEVLLSEKPDVILLDVMMPEMDGPTLFRLIKETTECKSTPVIFITAKVQKHEVEQYLKLGAAGVIPKPFDPMQLPTQILNILNG